MELINSTGWFLFGVIKRFYWLAPSLLSDPFDIAERWFGVNYMMPPYIFWILLFIGLLVASILTYHELSLKEGALNKQNNWIDTYKKIHHELPPIPEFMKDIILDYSTGMTLSRNIRLKIPSTQYWKGLLPSQRDKICELVEWLGQDRRDFLETIKRHSPPGPAY